DAAAPAEGHLPVAIEGTARVHTHGKRRQLVVAVPAHAEEIPDGALHRGMFLVVPIDANDGKAPMTRGGEPDLLNRAHAFDVGHLVDGTGRDGDTRAAFPTDTEIEAGGVVLRGGHAAPALFAGGVLGTDGTRLRAGQ